MRGVEYLMGAVPIVNGSIGCHNPMFRARVANTVSRGGPCIKCYATWMKEGRLTFYNYIGVLGSSIIS